MGRQNEQSEQQKHQTLGGKASCPDLNYHVSQMKNEVELMRKVNLNMAEVGGS